MFLVLNRVIDWEINVWLIYIVIKIDLVLYLMLMVCIKIVWGDVFFFREFVILKC